MNSNYKYENISFIRRNVSLDESFKSELNNTLVGFSQESILKCIKVIARSIEKIQRRELTLLFLYLYVAILNLE